MAFTTAATVWTTAAIGMAVGSGLYLIAVGTTVSVLVVLSIFIKLEPIIDTIHKERNYLIVCVSEPDVLTRFNKMYTECRLRCSRQKRTKKEMRSISCLSLWAPRSTRTGL